MNPRRRGVRAAVLAVLLAAGAWATPRASAAVPDWRAARVSTGYRLTAGSRDYVRNALLLRAGVPFDARTAAYARFDGARDRAYDWSLSWTAGLERELARRWLGWAGVGTAEAGLKDGANESSFLLEAGAGRELGRWWSDLEYRLTDGKVGRTLPAGVESGGAAPSLHHAAGSPMRHDDGHGGGSGQPPLTAPSETGEGFTQHELGLFVGSPVYPLWRGLSFGLSTSGWTRSGDRDGERLDGMSAGGGATLRLAPRWSLLLSVSADFPSRGERSVYGSAGVRYALLPGTPRP